MEPMEEEIYEKIQKGEIPERRYKKKDEQLAKALKSWKEREK
jgi:hypothetical protein